MKKAVAIFAVLLSMSSAALAYENDAVGFKVSNKYQVTTTTEATYAFISKANPDSQTQSTHTINYIPNEVASLIFGEQFSTSYFNEQYEKLSLLKRCDLSLKTIPLAIWNLDKYGEQGVELPYNNKLDEATRKKLKSFLGVEKIGKLKVITVSYLYKQNYKLYALNISLVSANDKLYALTTTMIDDKALAPKNDDKLAEVPAVIKRMQDKEAEQLVNVAPATLESEVRTKIWNEHINFIKSFKIK